MGFSNIFKKWQVNSLSIPKKNFFLFILFFLTIIIKYLENENLLIYLELHQNYENVMD